MKDLQKKVGGDQLPVSCPIGSTNHQWGMKKTPTDGSFTLSLPPAVYKVYQITNTLLNIQLKNDV